MDENLTDTQAEETFRDIQGALNNMMTSSLQYFPPFISCIQVDLKLKFIVVDRGENRTLDL